MFFAFKKTKLSSTFVWCFKVSQLKFSGDKFENDTPPET